MNAAAVLKQLQNIEQNLAELVVDAQDKAQQLDQLVAGFFDIFTQLLISFWQVQSELFLFSTLLNHRM